MRGGKTKPSRSEMELDLDNAVRRGRGLICLIGAALENNQGSGLSQMNESECTTIALLCLEVGHAMNKAQDALDADDCAQEKARRAKASRPREEKPLSTGKGATHK